MLVSLAIYLPKMDYPLWDPWEPHYSQVAMEMTQVDTWLTPTYRHSDRWFSKPVILFWFLKLLSPCSDRRSLPLASRLC